MFDLIENKAKKKGICVLQFPLYSNINLEYKV